MVGNTQHVPVEHDVEEDPGGDGVHDEDEAVHNLLGAAPLSSSFTHVDCQPLMCPPVTMWMCQVYQGPGCLMVDGVRVWLCYWSWVESTSSQIYVFISIVTLRLFEIDLKLVLRYNNVKLR